MPRSTAKDVATARRVDERAGTCEAAELFGEDGARMLGVRTAPLAPPAGAVLVCSSIANDLVKHYRREVLLGRALAGAGLAVQRFQYRGTGNSDGDAAELSRATMVADAVAAGSLLGAAAPGAPSAVVGTRFGALVAAEVAAGDTRPLVLVEPVLDGGRYFTEAFRAKLMQAVATAGAGRPTAAQFAAALERGEVVDVLGNPVHLALHDSWQGRSVVRALTGPRRPVLLVQFGDDVPVRADLAAAAAALRDAGHDVEVAQVRGRETWWYLDERDLVKGVAAPPAGAAGGNGRAAGNGNGDRGPEPADRPGATDGLLGAVVPWLTERLIGSRGRA